MKIFKEIGLVLLFALVPVLLLALVAGVISATGGSYLESLWRLCAFFGGIVLLLAAVLLLTNSFYRKKMELWENRFPHVRFSYALCLVGVVLILAAGVVNYWIL